MDLSTTSLEQLGTFAHGHYKAGEKAQEKAEQQMISAGLYLKEAKERLKNRKDMNFAQFLLHHCPIGKSRAYEVIAIADGRKTVDEVRERSNQSSKASHAKTRAETRESREAFRCSADKQPEKPNEINERPQQPKPKTFLDEAQAAHDALLKEVVALVRKQDTTTLLNIKELLQ